MFSITWTNRVLFWYLLASNIQMNLQRALIRIFECISMTVTEQSQCPPSVWPHPFCGAGHKKRRESSWSGPWHLVCTLEVSFSMHTATRTILYSPVGLSVFYISLVLYFVCLYCFNLFVSPSFCVSLSSWVISLTVLGASITNLNEPPRALATSTIAWVRS